MDGTRTEASGGTTRMSSRGRGPGSRRRAIAAARRAVLALLLVWSGTGGPAAAAPDRPVVFIPGILGSKLCRDDAGGETIVWGTLAAFRHVGALALAPGAEAAGAVRSCGLIREISVLGPLKQDFYGTIMDRLAAAGYHEGESLFVFDYDWRLSVFDNADRLAAFVALRMPEGTGQFDILAHSMGGLIGRVYLADEAGAPRVKRFITAGTPWEGSVRVFELLETGYGPANRLVGGLGLVRRTLLSFPSIYELVPTYEGCCSQDAGSGGAVDPRQPGTWPALGWQAAPDGTPDPALVSRHRARLAEIVATPLPAGVEGAATIGVDQRTAESVRLRPGDGGWRVDIKTGWSGDGVVVPASSRAGGGSVYPTSFSNHQAILSDPDVQDFVLAALRSGPEQALAAVPVRPRDAMETLSGRLVALVGVAVTTDAPVLATGEAARVRVILRLAELDPADPADIVLQAEHPDGRVETIPLARDPAGTDNPFEQVFEGRLSTGPEPGTLTLRAALDVAGGADRIAEIAVPLVQP